MPGVRVGSPQGQGAAVEQDPRLAPPPSSSTHAPLAGDFPGGPAKHLPGASVHSGKQGSFLWGRLFQHKRGVEWDVQPWLPSPPLPSPLAQEPLPEPEGRMGPHSPGLLMSHFTCSWVPPPTRLIPFPSNSSQAPTEDSRPVWRNLTLGHEATRSVAVTRPFPQKQEGSGGAPCAVVTVLPGGHNPASGAWRDTDRSHTAHPLCTRLALLALGDVGQISLKVTPAPSPLQDHRAPTLREKSTFPQVPSTLSPGAVGMSMPSRPQARCPQHSAEASGCREKFVFRKAKPTPPQDGRWNRQEPCCWALAAPT